MKMMKSLIAAMALGALVGCGTAYVPSRVSEAGGKVRVVPLNAETVLAANRSTYTPKTLPAVFFQTSADTAAGRGIGAAPDAVFDPQNKPASLPMRVPPAVANTPYEIGVGDVLLLATRGASSTVEELSGLLAAQSRRQGYTVQDDGAIAIPDVGRVQVAGMTLEEAEAALFQRLLESQIDPTFSLEIAEFNSKRVSIGGAVGSPTVLPVGLLPVTLDQALTSVGGVTTPDVDYASIRIYRDGTLYQIPLRNYLETPSLQKTRLLGGDAVYVDTEFDLTRAQSYFSEQLSLIQFRQSSRSQARAELQSAMAEARSNFQAQAQFDAVDRDYVYLTGEVKTPSRFALPMGRTASLADALYEQGGFASEKANPAQIYVLRGSDNPAEMGAVTAFHLNAREAANFVLATRMQLRPNDVIFVAEQPITKWNRFIQQLTPSIITTTVSAVNN